MSWLSSTTPRYFAKSTVESSFPRNIIGGTVVRLSIWRDPKTRNLGFFGFIKWQFEQHQAATHSRSRLRSPRPLSVSLMQKDRYDLESSTWFNFTGFTNRWWCFPRDLGDMIGEGDWIMYVFSYIHFVHIHAWHTGQATCSNLHVCDS